MVLNFSKDGESLRITQKRKSVVLTTESEEESLRRYSTSLVKEDCLGTSEVAGKRDVSGTEA